MKQGWTYKKLGQLSSITAGQGAPQGEDNYCHDGTPFIKAANLVDLVKGYSEYSFQQVSDQIAKKHRLKLFRAGSVIFAKSGMSCMKGWVYVLKNDCYVVSHLAVVSPNGINSRFLHYYLQYSRPNSLVKDAAFPSISLKDIENLIVPHLPKDEQENIVERLDAAFAQIDELKSNAERQLADARALFQSALTQAMQPKPGWQEKTLKEIVDANCPISYGIVQQGEHVSDGIPVVRPIDLNQKYVERKGLKCTDESISNRYKRTILQGNEILLSVRGTTGVLSLASPELKGCNVNRGIVPLFFKDLILRDFVYYYMESPHMQRIFAEKTTGSTLKQINIKDLRFIGVIYPPLSEQQAIVEHLDALSNHVKELEEISRKTAAECDAMKQALLRQIFE